MGSNQSLPIIEPHHDEQWELVDYDDEEWEYLHDYNDFADSDWYESLMAKKVY